MSLVILTLGVRTHIYVRMHACTQLHTQTHTPTSRTKGIVKSQACTGLWPAHAWFNKCMTLIKLLKYSHVSVPVHEVANPLDVNILITYRKIFKSTQHTKLIAGRINAKF